MSADESIAMQNGLHLTPQQVSRVVRARRCLLDKLFKVGQERRRLLSALGLQLLQAPQEEWAQSVPLQRLQNNLGQERAAASAFLFSTIDEVKACTHLLLPVRFTCLIIRDLICVKICYCYAIQIAHTCTTRCIVPAVASLF